jgi:multidrug resistance efflux pump
MSRVSRMPLDERARHRLREAQQKESEAVAAVHAADAARETAQAKLDALVRQHQDRIQTAEQRLSLAKAELVSVSGIERAASLLDQPVKALRAAVRAAKEGGAPEPATRHTESPS